jgi:hypothetical protein
MIPGSKLTGLYSIIPANFSKKDLEISFFYYTFYVSFALSFFKFNNNEKNS